MGPKGRKRVVFTALFHYHETIDVFVYRQEADDYGRYDKKMGINETGITVIRG